jgi:glycosyltransferase involved in cell wall biosynthesis
LTWNTFKTLHETLHILKEELIGIDAEVIIVDNGSTDGCENFATIKNPTNLGISKAKNQGIDASKGEYIFLIDGDVVPVPNSIVMLVKYLDENPGCKALGFLPNKFSNVKNQHRGQYHESYCHKLDPIIEHRGHCIYYGIYRREVFEKIRFDEQYGPGYGYEDLDSYMQMEAKGIVQWAAGMNSLNGKYFHAINSSINNKNCLGFEEYMRSSMKRSQIFQNKWSKRTVHACANIA